MVSTGRKHAQEDEYAQRVLGEFLNACCFARCIFKVMSSGFVRFLARGL